MVYKVTGERKRMWCAYFMKEVRKWEENYKNCKKCPNFKWEST